MNGPHAHCVRLRRIPLRGISLRLSCGLRPGVRCPPRGRNEPFGRQSRLVINLLDLDAAGLAALFADLGEKPFRAKQVSRWVHQRLVDGPDAMTDLSRAVRARLAEIAAIRGPTVIGDAVASDGTRKWLLDVGAGNAVEAVYIPEDDRGTLCISSQAGCALDCAFCSTGKQGFNRNLSTGEIVGQLWHANRALLADGVSGPWVEHGRAPITNVVLM